MTLEIHFLDVGQGDCTVLLFKDTKGKVIRSVVIDCGGTNAIGSGEEENDSKDEQQAGKKLLAFYAKHDIDLFDIWIITHWDKDHFGGFNYILRQAKVDDDIRNKLEHLCIYDRGECFNYNLSYGQFTAGGFNKKTPYVSFRHLLCDVKKKDEDLELERTTELVYGNDDYGGEKFKLTSSKDSLKPFRFISSTPDTSERYVFRGPDYLLGEDLLNRDFTPKIEACLECLIVNGWYLDKRDKVSYTDVRNPKTDKENCRSMGLLLTFGKFSCWFGGDLESAIEDTLIATIQARIGERPLSMSKASHHGSDFSTSDDFINQLQPDVLIVSAPPESKLHPHPLFLKRVAENEFIKAVYLTGCHPYIGDDEQHDGFKGSVITGITTEQLLGLSGELIPTSDLRKFYVCGGTEHSTNELYSGDIWVSTAGGWEKDIGYWEAFGQLVLSRHNSKEILKKEPRTLDLESVVNYSGDLHEDITIDHDDTYSKSVVMKKPVLRKKKKSKKRKIEETFDVIYVINGLDMVETVEQQKKRRKHH
jgi:beta-lactamase superfamily II metal-dependent hydrolase